MLASLNAGRAGKIGLCHLFPLIGDALTTSVILHRVTIYFLAKSDEGLYLALRSLILLAVAPPTTSVELIALDRTFEISRRCPRGVLMKIDFPSVCARLIRFVSADRGQSMTEYALICALMAFAATAGDRGLADGVSEVFNHISSTFVSAFASGSGGGGTVSGASAGAADAQ